MSQTGQLIYTYLKVRVIDATVRLMSSLLIIEDDKTIVSAYKTVLSQEGYTIFASTSGREGLTLLSKEHIDLILLDIMLPDGMNGFDILMQLKQSDKTKNIPVIVMTNLESEKKTALDYGAIDYILKANTDMRQLVEKVKTVLPPTAL
jgi:DNA-binding response OmpR family regulator